MTDRRVYLDEWFRMGVGNHGVTFGDYARHREDGTWEAYCVETWGRYRFDPQEVKENANHDL